jgi:ER membrane protein complex subunit 6
MLQVLTQLRSLSASVFGVAAGVLGLEALWGFAFYAAGTVLMSALVAIVLAGGIRQVPRYFEDGAVPSLREGKGNKGERGMRRWEGGWGWGIWSRDIMGGLMSYILTWTLFYGLLRS